MWPSPLLSPDSCSNCPPPKRPNFFFLKTCLLHLTQKLHNQEDKWGGEQKGGDGSVGGVAVDPALAEPRWGKPSLSVRFPSPTAAGRPVGGEGGALRGTSAPRTASRPPHIPAWRSTFAGKCPGWVGREGGQGGPGGRESRIPTLHPWRFGIFPPQAHIPPATTNLPHLPVPSFVFRGRIPASYRSITDAFTEHLLSTCGSSWEVDLQPQASEPALQHSISPLH